MPHVTTIYQDDVLARLEAVAQRLAKPGIQVTRSDAIRAAVLRGLLELETELGLSCERKAEER